MSFMAILSYLGTFLFGVAIGAAGHYFGEKYTDRRRDKEAERKAKRAFNELAVQMPTLFRAFRADLEADPKGVVREFFASRSSRATITSSKARFRYNQDEIGNLLESLDLLAQAGLIVDVRTTDLPIYRFEEQFVQRLRGWQK